MKVNSKEQLDDLSNSGSVFTKVEKGDMTIRIMSDLYVVKEHRINIEGKWKFPACPTENARMRIAAGETQDTEVPPCPLCELGYPVQTSYMCAIVERERKEFNKKGQEITLGGEASVLKKGAGLMGGLQKLLDDENWGKTGNYDVKISATGDNLQRKYSVSPIPAEKSPELTQKEKFSFDELTAEVDFERMTTPNSYAKIKEMLGSNFPEYTPPVKPA